MLYGVNVLTVLGRYERYLDTKSVASYIQTTLDNISFHFSDTVEALSKHRLRDIEYMLKSAKKLSISKSAFLPCIFKSNCLDIYHILQKSSILNCYKLGVMDSLLSNYLRLKIFRTITVHY
jgi:hypothetical protein